MDYFCLLYFFFLSAAINFQILGCLQVIEERSAEWKPQQRYLFLGDLRQPFFNIPKTHWIKWIFSPCSSTHHANIVSVYVSNKESSFFFPLPCSIAHEHYKELSRFNNRATLYISFIRIASV